jgi:hypothetical protein
MRVTEYPEIDFNAQPAYKIIYTGREAGEPYKWMGFIVRYGGRLADIGYTYSLSEFDRYSLSVEEIIKSFVLK